MISFLDYVKYNATLPADSGVVFSGRYSNIANNFPKGTNSKTTTQAPYFYYSKDIEDMEQYGFVGFFEPDEDFEVIYNNTRCYKYVVYINTETKEPIGYFYRNTNTMAIITYPNYFSLDNVDYTIQTKNDTYNEFKNGSTYYTVAFKTEIYALDFYGMINVPYTILEKKPNYYIVIYDRGWNCQGNEKQVIAYLDIENEKVMWMPTRNGGVWEDFIYDFGSDNKRITKTLPAYGNFYIYVNVNDEDFSNFQKNSSDGTLIVADWTMFSNTGKQNPSQEIVYDVPQKLIEKYGDVYKARIVKVGSTNYRCDALLFAFITPTENNSKDYVYIIYHPSTHNWCEICRRLATQSEFGINDGICEIEAQDLISQDNNMRLNWIDQSSIDLDIYKKMAEIGNGLMLFDDETEDLKYLYDTKNKELYNEYCDLVGTNAITFKK